MFKEIAEATATAMLLAGAASLAVVLTSMDMCERITPHDSMASSACVRSEIQSLADRAESAIKKVTGDANKQASTQDQR